MSSTLLFSNYVDNIYLEGNVSQIFVIGPSFFLCQKRETFYYFFKQKLLYIELKLGPK